MSVDPVEILHETDRILDRKGWSSDGPGGDDGEVCLAVAICEAQGKFLARRLLDARRDEYRAVKAEITALTEGATEFAGEFNDRIAESLEDIKRVTKGARVRLGGEA